MFFGGPKRQMQLKKGSGREEADVFPSGSCMQGVCKAQPWAPLAHRLPSPLHEVWAGHPPEVTDSFQQLDCPSICRAGVLVSPETDPYKHIWHPAGLQSRQIGGRKVGTAGRKVAGSAGNPRINLVPVAQAQEPPCWCMKGNTGPAN